MQAAQGTPILDRPPTTAVRRPRRRLAGLALVLLAVVALLVILPPFLSLARYQRRVTGSMSQILGRPVHLDNITLNLLPFPSFTMQNLVVDELPPFGSEPLLRAATVDARLRLLPLWRHRVEFSRITFHDPSVNLVRNPAGPRHWNLESILLQAAHIDAAPTSGSPTGSGYTPRFPYIEATNARVNLKLGAEKTPFSATEADFALWLPEPNQWRMRLRAHPSRTDTNASDTGTVQVEATLQRARSVDAIPLDLDASWTGAPLGEASLVLAGTDIGLRGDLRVDAHIHGTLADSPVTTSVHLENLHRSDFVPERTADIDLSCSGRLTRVLHTAEDLRCRWPLADHHGLVTVAGTVPDLLAPSTAELALTATAIPAGTVLNWLRIVSNRVSPTLTATGELTAVAALNVPLPPLPTTPASPTSTPPELSSRPEHSEVGQPALSLSKEPALSLSKGPASPTLQSTATTTPFAAELSMPSLTLSGGRLGDTPITTGAIGLSALSATPLFHGPLAASALKLSLTPFSIDLSDQDTTATSQAAPVLTASKGPASPRSSEATLQGSANAESYTIRLSGPVSIARLLALGTVLPQFGDGLADTLADLTPARHTDSPVRIDSSVRIEGPVRIDLSAHRPWGGPQVWSTLSTPAPLAAAPNTPHRRR